MSEKQEIFVKLYPMRTWYRELWSDFCTFSTVAALFAVGWWFDSSAMQWFAFVTSILIIAGKANGRIKKFSPQEAADFLSAEYDVRARTQGAE